MKENEAPEGLSVFVPHGENVHAETNARPKPVDAGLLLQKALEAAEMADQRVEEAEGESELLALKTDKAAWPLIQAMVELSEKFDLEDGTTDEAALESFLVLNGAKPHGNVQNPWQRLAKLCCPNSKPPLVTKRGQVLAVLRDMKVRSADVLGELSKSESVGPKGAERTGMERLRLRFAQMQKEQRARTRDLDDNPPESASPGLFANMNNDQFEQHVTLVIAECERRGLHAPKLMGQPERQLPSA